MTALRRRRFDRGEATLAWYDGGGAEAEFARVAVPALVCGTEEDAVLALARRLAAMLPAARLAVLPPKGRDRAAHFAELHAALAAFLTEA